MGTEVDVNDNGTIDIQYGGTNASTVEDARTNLGLGSSAQLDAGNAVGEVVVVQTGNKLPALDGSDLINVPAAGGSVNSINGETGDVVLTGDDIGDGVTYAIITKVEQANIARNTLITDRFEDLEDYVDDAEAAASAAAVSETNAATSASEASDSADEAANIVGTIPLSAGMLEAPTYIDHVDGSITIDAEDCNLFETTDHTGQLSRFSIAADTFTLADNDTTYITVDYNSGVPIYVATTVVGGINESDIIPVYTINRNGTVLSIMSWDGLGVGLSNKLHARFVKTDRLKRESGLALSESATRVVEIGAGIAWVGAASNSVAAFASNTDSLRFFYHTGGAWASSIITQYNNTQYDDGTNLQTLGTAKYTVNWIFRNVVEDGRAGVVLGSGSYNLAEALDSPLPASLPENILAQGILVGRIIVQKDAASSEVIQSAFVQGFAGGAAIQQHNDLAGLQGGAVGDYQHLTTTELTKLTGVEDNATADQSASEIKSLYESNSDTNAFTDEDIVLQSVTSETDFMARAAENNDKFGGSGFVEMGKHRDDDVTYFNVNTGITAVPNTTNRFYIGRHLSSQSGASKTEYPTVNINGVDSVVRYINGIGGSSWSGEINFPDAPLATNLVTNGTFDTDTDWTKDAGWTIGSGIASCDGSTGFIHQTGTLIVGRVYIFEYEITNYTSGYVKFYTGAGSDEATGRLSNGKFRDVFVANSTSIYFYSSTFNGSIDNAAIIDLGKVERQDLVFLESWHEKIGDKNIVYPYGNVQSLLATDTATGLTTVSGSFTGYSTYSLFGNWQDPSDLIGKGLVWSTMSDVNKKKFVSDPENNIYLAEDGELVQVRYRIRVVEGLGADWENINPHGNNYLRYSPTSWVQMVEAKGSKTVLTNDITDLTNDSSYFGGTDFNELVFADQEEGAFKAIDRTAAGWVEEDLTSYKGLCFALPIALVSRRNQGAFHPVFNPNGAAEFGDSNPWYSSSDSMASTLDCFTSVGDGSISGVASGRPDDKYYDAIYESDVLDLRNSSHKPLDLNRTLEREFNKLVAGETRGWEKQSTILLANENPTSAGTTSRLNYTGIEDYAEVGDEVIIIQTGVPFKGFVTIVGTDYIDIENRTYPAFAATATGDTFCLNGLRLIEAKTLLHCDIIGDPANYPQGWIDDGVTGTPLLVGEEGEDLIPDGISKTFKLSRKCVDCRQVLYSDNSGVDWTQLDDGTGSISTGFEGNTNAWTSGQPLNRLIMIFYLTEASPFEIADNAEVLSLNGVFASNKVENNSLSYLLHKVLVGSDRSTYPLQQYLIETDLDSVDVPEHNTISALIDNLNPAVKVLPYLTRENGKLFLQTLFKEMKYDTDWGDDSKFDVVDDTSTTTDDNANTVLIGQKRLELPYFIGDGE